MTDVTMRVPSAWRELAGGSATVTVSGATVGEALERFVADHPALRRHLFTPEGRLRSFVSLYLNDTDTRERDGLSTSLDDGDRLAIVPAIAGGAPDAEPAAPGASPVIPLSREELKRYSRHLILPEVGVAGQKRLRDARVLVVGAGGLGAPATLYLAAAGVGEIGLVDFDRIDTSNLQRQVLYATSQVGRPKTEAAKQRLEDLNPGVTVRTYEESLDRNNALRILRDYDVILDGTDNFPTRYLVNDACVLLGKPDVFGSVYRFEGQVSVFDAHRGPCYRCLYAEPPPPGVVPSCAEGGVLGVLPGLIGLVQATEAIKLLLGIGEPLIGRLLLFDALGMQFRELTLRKSPDCVLCGPRATQTELIDYPAFCGIVPGPDGASLPEVSPEGLAEELRGGSPPVLVDVREPGEWAIGHLPGARLIPRAELAERLTELASAPAIVVYCKTGARSAMAQRLLLDLGFDRVRNLRGGLDAWARQVDPTMPEY